MMERCCKRVKDSPRGVLSFELYQLSWVWRSAEIWAKYQNSKTCGWVENWPCNFLLECWYVWWQERKLFYPRRGSQWYMIRCTRTHGCWDTVSRTWLPGMKNFCKGWVIFFFPMALLEFALVSEKAIKKFLPWGGGGNPPPPYVCSGGVDFPPPPPLKYKVA